MNIAEIDQSGKIEDTSHDTIIAISNHIKSTITLKKTHKRIIQNIFRQLKKPKLFIPITFSALLSLLIKNSKSNQKIIIDREYTGYESLIIKLTKNNLEKLKCKNNNIEFQNIGKNSPAHDLASKVSHHKKISNKIVTFEEICLLLFSEDQTKKNREVLKPGLKPVGRHFTRS